MKIVRSLNRFGSSNTKERSTNQWRPEAYETFSYWFWSFLLTRCIFCTENSTTREQDGYPGSNRVCVVGEQKGSFLYLHVINFGIRWNDFTLPHSPVGWDSRICRMYLCRGIRPRPNKCPGYDTKLHLMEKFGEMWSTPSLPLLPGPLWPRVAVPVRFLSMSQIELFNHLLYLKTFNCAPTHN